MSWTQVYEPVAGNLGLSTLVAAVPVVVLLGLLAFFHVRAHVAALAGLAAALLIAILVYKMPAALAGMSAVYGAAFGLLAGSSNAFRTVFFGVTSLFAMALLGTILVRLPAKRLFATTVRPVAKIAPGPDCATFPSTVDPLTVSVGVCA